MKKFLLLPCLLCCCVLPVFAQSPTLDEQYEQIKTEIEVVDGYRIVKMYKMDKVWASVSDSLRAMRAQQTAHEEEIDALTNQVAVLKAAMEKKESNAAALQEAVSSMTFLNWQVDKTAFVSIALIVVASLLGVIVFSWLVTAKFRKLWSESKHQYEIVSRDFEQYKHQAIEKQIKLSRELQTERNRIAELRHAV